MNIQPFACSALTERPPKGTTPILANGTEKIVVELSSLRICRRMRVKAVSHRPHSYRVAWTRSKTSSI